MILGFIDMLVGFLVDDRLVAGNLACLVKLALLNKCVSEIWVS